jgi:hypothetical protein
MIRRSFLGQEPKRMLSDHKPDPYHKLRRKPRPQRLDWIRRSHTTATDTPATFAVQPYEQLERVYRRTGQYREAARIRTARFRDPRRYGSLTRTAKAGNVLFDKLFGYGYQPMRAIAWLIGLYAVVLLVFLVAQHQDGLLVPAKDTKSLTPAPTALQCSAGYPCFYPAGYAVDVVVPIINLRQAENWRPNGDAAWGWAYIVVVWVGTGLGWAFTTIAVVAYTGLVRKD